MTHALGLDDVAGEVSAWARAIVTKRLAILAGVPVVLTLLAAFGVDLNHATVTHEVTAILDAVGLIAGAVAVHAAVTPASPGKQPVSSNGFPLVELRGAETDPALEQAEILDDDSEDPIPLPSNEEAPASAAEVVAVPDDPEDLGG